MTPRSARRTQVASWLALTAALVWAGTRLHSDAVQFLCLLAAAACLRMALLVAWPGKHAGPGTRIGEDSRPVVVKLRGEVTRRNADRVAHRITTALSPAPAQLQVDMRKVTLISSDGPQALFTAVRTARHRGVPVVIVGANAQVRSTLHHIGLDPLLTYSDHPGS